MERRTTFRALALALGLALCLAFAQGAAAAAVRDTTLSKDDLACLSCHGKEGLAKPLKNGEKLSLYIAPQAFAQSLHNSSGCEGCHSDLDAKTHGKPGGEKAMASKRAHSVDMTEACRDCHKKTMKQFDDSVHAALVKDGNAKAPVCADCHNPHATRSAKHGESGEATVLCAQCHKPLTEAYAKSVHGSSGDEALECKDCHRTHNVKAATAGDHLRAECMSCHKDAGKTHATWLPNAGLHLQAVACAACHVPNTTRRVDLRIYEAGPGHKAAEKAGVPQFVKLTSTSQAGAGLDGRALWGLLQDLSGGAGDSKSFVRGRLEVGTGIEAHSLAPKAKALKDCATCHKQGAAAFQSVTVSMIGADGRPVRRGATGGILASAESLGAVGGFYAIGGTRIAILDILLVLTLAAGIGIPALHLAAKVVTARRRAAAPTESKE